MAVVLRLKRTGRRNLPHFRICVFDTRTRRDGRSIEEIGHYEPLKTGDGPQFELNEDRARYWISVGAQPSETVGTLLKRCNIEFGKSLRSKNKKKSKASAAKS